jgi:hypothetical protein
MLFDFFCLSLSNAAVLAHAVIIKMTRRREEGIGEEVLRGEGLEGEGLKREGLKGLFFV